MSAESITLYAIRRSDGKWFRAKGYGGYGDSWVADLSDAKLYSKIAQARGRVTFFSTPGYEPPKLVEFTATMTRVVDERERVAESKRKKAIVEAERVKRGAELDLREAERTLAETKAKIARLKSV